MKNLIDEVCSNEKLRGMSRLVLLMLIGRKIAQKPFFSIESLREWGFEDPYVILGELQLAGYIKGAVNDYDLDYADLAPLIKPLETSGNSPKTAPELNPSVLYLVKLFRKLHKDIRSLEPIVGTNDLVMMRSICKHVKPKDVEPLFRRFFGDITTNRNKLTRYGISDLQKFAERMGYIEKKKFSPKLKRDNIDAGYGPRLGKDE